MLEFKIRIKLIFKRLFSILSDEDRFNYCLFIRDSEKMWSKISDDTWKMTYCLGIVDRSEIWSTITDDHVKQRYCQYVRERKEIWETIISDAEKYEYCLNVKDRKELWSNIRNTYWKQLYCENIKDRPELRDIETVKYLVREGEVFCQDGDVHFISYYHIMSLYKVSPRECIRADQWHTKGFSKEYLDNLIKLYPQDNGIYKIPEVSYRMMKEKEKSNG